jgi:hypothetical protein
MALVGPVAGWTAVADPAEHIKLTLTQANLGPLEPERPGPGSSPPGEPDREEAGRQGAAPVSMRPASASSASECPANATTASKTSKATIRPSAIAMYRLYELALKLWSWPPVGSSW